jgi:hypothetical protein
VCGEGERALTALGVENDIKVHPGRRPRVLSTTTTRPMRRLRVLIKVSGTRYHEPSARDAAAI